MTRTSISSRIPTLILKRPLKGDVVESNYGAGTADCDGAAGDASHSERTHSAATIIGRPGPTGDLTSSRKPTSRGPTLASTRKQSLNAKYGK